MGVGITGSRTLLIRIGAIASSEAQVHTSSMSGDQGKQGKLGIPLFRGSCIPFLSVFASSRNRLKLGPDVWILSSTTD